MDNAEDLESAKLPQQALTDELPAVRTDSQSRHQHPQEGDGASSNAPARCNPFITEDFSGRLLAFPFRLHRMLEDVEKHGKEDIVSWMPSGRSFKVHKPTEFVDEVASVYFNLTKFKSFKRQLLNYGFMRVQSKSDNENGGFYHPFFLRHDPSTCRFIGRDKQKSQASIDGPCEEPLERTIPNVARRMLNSNFVLDDMVGRSNFPVHQHIHPHIVSRGSQSDAPDTKMPAFSSSHPAFLPRRQEDHRSLTETSADQSSDFINLIGEDHIDRGMMKWLLGGAISLPDLGNVLKSYQYPHPRSSSEAAVRRQSPTVPSAVRNHPLSTSMDHANYQEEIISLFGGSQQDYPPNEMLSRTLNDSSSDEWIL